MSHWSLIVSCVLLLVAPAGASGRFPRWLGPCEEGPSGALCGRYEVWEDRAATAGRRIELFVMILPATGNGPYEAPIVPLAGGPGQAASDAANMAAALFEPLRATRDIVLIDQRGTGRSHRLDCGALPEGAPLQTYFEDFPTPEFTRLCRERQDANVALYTTDMAVGDLEELRSELGYSQLNLYGGSYGTRVGLHYLRRHPDRVRAMVLDGVSPPHTGFHAQFGPALEKTLAFLFERCAADTDCAKQFPSLEADWSRALGRFSDGPVEFLATHPVSREQEPVRFSQGLFVDTVRRMLYGAQGWPRVVTMIDAAAGGDFSDFVAARYTMHDAVMRSFGLGMLLTITCTESVPFVSEGEIARISAGTSLGGYRARTIRTACEEWPEGTVPADWSTPVTADAPVLLLSGAIDPATPPWIAVEVAAALPQGKHVIVPNRSHAPTDFECETAVIQAFLEAGSAEGLDVSCLEAVEWPAFAPIDASVVEVEVDPEILRSFVGSYELQPGFTLVVSFEEDRLFIQPPGESKRALRAIGDGAFLVEGLGAEISFISGEDGQITAFQLKGGPRARKVE